MKTKTLPSLYEAQAAVRARAANLIAAKTYGSGMVVLSAERRLTKAEKELARVRALHDASNQPRN